MRKIYFTLFAILTFFVGNARSQETTTPQLPSNGQYVVKTVVPTLQDVANLYANFSVDKVRPTENGQFDVTIYFSVEEGLGEFKKMNLKYELIPEENNSKALTMATTVSQMASWDRYPTLAVYREMMSNFMTNYPSFCDIDTIVASTGGGRPILVAHLSTNVNTPADKPEFWYASAMHGDELASIVLMLRLIDYLLVNYGTDADATYILDNVDLWISPMDNPDGTYYNSSASTSVSSSRRYNKSGYDLNRSCKQTPNGGYTNGSSVPEVVGIENFASAHNFTMGGNFHGGTEVFNYPWDYQSTSQGGTHADNDWFVYVATNYAEYCQSQSSGYFTCEYSSGITQGGDWYVTTGCRQDYLNYYHHCKESTIEINQTKQLPVAQLDAHWGYNKQALIDLIKESTYGFNGVVYDATNPDVKLAAKVFVNNHDERNTEVYSQLPVGDYHRPIQAGTHSVTVSADCYIPQTFNVTTTYGAGVRRDVALQPVAPTPVVEAQTIVSGNTATLTNTATNSYSSTKWYASATSTTVLYTGTSYTTPTLSATTTYYVANVGTGNYSDCSSTRIPVVVTVTANNAPMIVAENVTPATLVFGETTPVTLTMINNGNVATTSNTTVTIACTDSDVTVTDATETYPAMTANGGTATVTNGFTFTVADNIQNTKTVTVNVTAVNGNDSWNSSFIISLQGIDCDTPTNLTASPSETAITLSWTGSANTYILYRDNTQIATGLTTLSYTDSGLTTGQQYCYQVQSVCDYGSSNISSSACATTQVPEYYVPSTGSTTITACGGTVYDHAGPNANYSNNVDGYLIVYPTSNDALVQVAGSYTTESRYDYLYVYDGAGTSGTQLGKYSGTGTVPTLQSTTGPLTIRFTSDYSQTKEGFELTLSCYTACTAPTITITSSDDAICSGENVTLTAAGATYYSWNTGATSASITVSPTSNTTYTVTGYDVADCTGTASKTITVNQATTATETATICEGSNYDFYGQTLTTAGTYTYETTNANGCLHTITLILTVNPTTYETINATICEGSSYIYNGTAYTTTGTYTINTTNTNGCLHVVTLNLTVNNPAVVITTSAETVCAETSVTLTASGTDSYLWSTGATTSSITVTPTATTTYSVTGYDNNSCEATDAITITVNSTTSETINASICAGESYIYNGTVYTTTGTYTINTTNANGCLHVVTLNLTVYEVENQTITATICAGETYTENGFNVSVAGTYTRTATNANGCEYTVTLILTVNPTTYETINATICEGETYIYNGTAYTTTGTYTINTTNANGCLHVVTLNLTVNNPAVVITASAETVCAGTNVTLTASGTDSYLWSTGATTSSITVTPTATTTYSVTGYDNNSCEATDAITITVNPTTSETINASICAGESYIYNGTVYTTTGTYTINTTNANGCLHVVTLNLTVYEVENQTITATICAGETYTENGFNVSVAGTYTRTATNANGCEYTVTLILTVNPTTFETIDATICAGESYIYNGTVYTTTGTYTINTTNANGCLHVVTLNLTVNEATSNTTEATICGNETYEFYGTTYSTSGTYTYETTNANGCAHTEILVLTVNPTTSETIDASICAGETYTYNGVNYTTAGIYTINTTNANGCLHVVTLNLTVVTAEGQTIEATICEGDVYDAHGFYESLAGTYTRTATNANGCEYTVTLILTVNPTTFETIDATICAGESYIYNGTVYTTTGTYTINTTNANGCLHVVTLNLTVNEATSNTTEATICGNETYEFYGTTYNTSGTYTYETTNANGCAHTEILVLTVNPTTSETIDATICTGETYTYNGVNYTTAGIYTINTTNANGCLHVVTLNLTVVTAEGQTIEATICEGDVYDAHGFYESLAGTYTRTETNANGCEYTITLILTVNPTTFETIDATICAGETYIYNGTAYTTTGTYTINTTNANGCLHVVTLNLTVNEATSNTTEATICGNETYEFYGTTYNTSGTYTYETTNANGCAHTEILVLTVNPTTSETINATICTGETYTYNGVNYTTAGIYTINTTNANGCLHVATLNLTVVTAEGQTIEATICEGDVYDANGFYELLAGTYTRTATNANGCEYTVTLILTVNPTTYETIDATICEGETYTYNGVNYTTAGIYTINTTNANGCLHVVTLNLTVNEATSNTTEATICGNETYEFYGTTYNTSGTYTYETTNANGCAHTEILVLTVNPTTSETINANICDGESYIYNGTTYTETGLYTINTTNEYGCLHVITLNLTIQTPEVVITGKDVICMNVRDTLTASGASTYRWSTGENTPMIIIRHTVSNTYTYSVTGYDDNGCSATTDFIVTVNPITYDTVYATICQGDKYLYNGVYYVYQSMYTFRSYNEYGCYHYNTLNLTVNPVSSDTTMATICGDTEYVFHGQTFNETGFFAVDTLNSYGCTHTHYLDLIVNPVTADTTSITLCEGESYEFNGVSYTETGVYSYETTNEYGCLHTVVLNLTVNPVTSETIEATICTEVGYYENGFNITAEETATAGVYNYQLDILNANGCTHTVYLILTVEECAPATCPLPESFNATYSEPALTLTWEAPGSNNGEWVSWSGEKYTAIGTMSPIAFMVAHRYEPTDLTSYDGMMLTRVSFFPNASNCYYQIRVWAGGSTTSSGTLLLSQDVDASTLTIGAWNTIYLDTPVEVDASKEFWIGYRVETTQNYQYPAGCDSGPKVSYKGNMMYFNTEWNQMSFFGSSLTYNWCIRGYLQNLVGGKAILTPVAMAENEEMPSVNGKLIAQPVSATTATAATPPESRFTAYTYNVYKNGQFVTNTSSTYYVDENVGEGSYEYCITAVTDQCESDMLCKTVDIYSVAVSATPSTYGYATGAGLYMSGTSVTVTAVPTYWWIKLYKWIENGITVSNQTSYTFTISSSRNLVASLKSKYSFKSSMSKEGAGAIIANNDYYDEGETATAVAIPNSDFEFVGWSVDGEIVSTETEFSVVMEKDIEVEAVFENVKVDIFPNPVMDDLTVNCEDIVRIIILNSNGVVVKTIPINHANSAVISTDGMNKGSYILNIITDKRTFVRKFVKI